LDIVQKIWAPLGKLFAPPGVPSWLRSWARSHGGHSGEMPPQILCPENIILKTYNKTKGLFLCMCIFPLKP